MTQEQIDELTQRIVNLGLKTGALKDIIEKEGIK
ncbi:hypothetical protein STSC103643_06390 [Staphylococcus schleiferi subsp. schleiferi]|uniref:Uncharacterized protein n=1 Tax=Staphylococcus schleiferi TaxID=1295 RepID=A0A7Z7VXD9_STASC|nr:Uncharacterised protein [Staphylococcus schleiferi]SUM88999.1 Uncharacterised protein [Staphylococcus schleiferi]